MVFVANSSIVCFMSVKTKFDQDDVDDLYHVVSLGFKPDEWSVRVDQKELKQCYPNLAEKVFKVGTCHFISFADLPDELLPKGELPLVGLAVSALPTGDVKLKRGIALLEMIDHRQFNIDMLHALACAAH
uniref:Uncharacterized protein n=1 Tax=Chromera velia CCMP2878 TaxID=1169474 RepID=A0A0G4H8Q8_9ALVE|mmetsp:Transcript_37208/g.73209  ORF Transcript_37208/g.73209 Transcript_37208/m.73209 type:complete len:130 (+) Transcript_37208:937-1326(+)|eukprot:Cvel_5909.t1-p1 / transcript=Cvel_5909.t1 / gene=Cvel_5909 / organism=Chromera_velia_CCMP2878 / gene_product=hypothetical protein / transcript_product=hypothetical protein / location=Cvel_scaffold282:21503-22008(-) / protein_length=129 / sequence_SO=supercontig / SO=protein_coding / is_pseudo=false